MTYLIDSFPEKIFWAELTFAIGIEYNLSIFMADTACFIAKLSKIKDGKIKKYLSYYKKQFFVMKIKNINGTYLQMVNNFRL
jgi:hypothetical protein